MSKTAYHHGNLRAEVLAVGLERVRAGGMQALVAREVARAVGVTPAALYRHFPDAEHLRAEVSREARQQLALAMLQARDAAPRRRDLRARAIGRFQATGLAYTDFARREPGLFDAAFAACAAPASAPDDPSAWDVLGSALDELVEAGALPGHRRADAPILAWTAVHGLATILAAQSLPPGTSVEHLEQVVVEGVQRAIGVADADWTPRRSGRATPST